MIRSVGCMRFVTNFGIGVILSLLISISPLWADYCPASGSGIFVSPIQHVMLKTIDNTTGSEAGGYGNYTSLSTVLEKTTAYPIRVYASGGIVRVWVDWNQDFDFDDAGEMFTPECYIYKDPPYGNVTILNGHAVAAITPPADALTGPTRMRIRSKECPPCGNISGSEAEDYTVIVAELGTGGEEAYGGGMGTAEQPFLIYTAAQFNAIGQNNFHWAKHFRLMNNLDLRDLGSDPFHSIGDYEWGFSGTFDGNGRTIHHWSYYNSTQSWLGLFGVVNSPNASIRNLSVDHIELITDSGNAVGSIAAVLKQGTISNCVAANCLLWGNKAVGGLVGGLHDRIEFCSAQASVTGSFDAGGLVGRAEGGTIVQSFSLGSVKGTGPAGGLVGYASSPFRADDCYSLSGIQGINYVGGLIGYLENSNLYRCYAAGLTLGQTNVGGLVGYKSTAANATACFWDGDTTNCSASPLGTKKTTPQMKTRSTFTDAPASWDFLGESTNGTADTWRMCVDGVQYPKLTWEYDQTADFACPDGTGPEDAVPFFAAWLTYVSDPAWNPRCDLNSDAIINLLDYRILALHWLGQTTPEAFCQSWLARPADAHWNPRCDLNTDALINLLDYPLLSSPW